MAKRSKEAILEDFRDVDCGFSPENLTCDGELSASQVRNRKAELDRQRAALVAELGYSPTAAELYPEIYGRNQS